MKGHFKIFSLLVILCFGQLQVEAQKISYENGVKTVENGNDGMWGKNPQIKLEYMGKFGNHNDKDITTIFARLRDIAFDQSGNLYVLDAGSWRISKFNRNRKFLYSFGTKGRGPGELLEADKISISPNGNIYVSESAQMRVNIYSNNGKSIGTIKTRYDHFPMIMVSDDKMIVSNPIFTGAGAPHKPVLLLMDTKGNKIKSFGEGPFPKTGNKKSDGNLAAGNQLRFTVDNNMNTYAAFLFAPYIEKFDKEGKTVLRLKKKAKPGVDNLGVAVDSKERIWVLTKQRYLKPEELAGTSGIIIDEDRTVTRKYKGDRTLNKTDAYALELFDNEGRFLHRFPLNHFVCNFSMDPTSFGIKINKNEIYIIENLREMTFHVYKISDL